MTEPHTDDARGGSFLRIELARSLADFDTAVAGRRQAVRTGLQTDFGFIAAYWLLFVTTGALFATRDTWGAAWLGTAAAELATIGAVCDLAENLYALTLLRAETDPPGEDRAPLVARMRGASLTKWASVFAATAILSVMFFERGGWSCVLAAVYAISAALGLAAIALEAAYSRTRVSDAWLERLLRLSFLGMGVALLVGLAVAASQT